MSTTPLTEAETDLLATAFATATRSPHHLAFLAKPAVEALLAAREAAAAERGARQALTALADQHERIADMLAITHQDPDRRKAATWPHRWLTHILRAALRSGAGS